MILENDGYRLTSLCGYSVKNRAQYVGVWMKLVSFYFKKQEVF